ncbi:MAG: segregation/condensation protein A [bacterium]|nr:segregation/condensation protein A [bacterium]
MNTYEVKLQQFSGPLGKLLELIEEKKLEITSVNLADVTADFLRYVKTLEKSAPALIADFLVVAARLVLIKSKVLLPMLELSKDEEEEIKDLEGRLRIYREFKVAGEHIKKLWDKNSSAYARPLLSSLGEQSIFYPSTSLKLGDLTRAINNLVAALKVLLPEEQTIKRAIVTIEQKIEELLNRLKAAGQHSFKTMSEQKTRNEVIVLFLAILHLLKDRIINAEQGDQFSDIAITKISNF